MKNKGTLIIMILTATLPITMFTPTLIKWLYDNNNQKRFKGIEHLMMKTSDNLCISADTDNPIGIILKNATESEKQDVINAIEQINNFSPNIEYVLCESDNLTLENCIYIYTDQDIQSDISESIGGLTTFKYNDSMATIQYPITIYIDEDVKNIYDTENNISGFSYVLKHELMHTLGFTDLYSEEYFNKSIMYYKFDISTEITGFTDFDIKNIQQVYGGYSESENESLSAVQYPYIKRNDYFDENEI